MTLPRARAPEEFNMQFPVRPATALVAAMALAGCTSLPRERGYSQTGDLIEARLGARPAWSLDAALSPMPPPEIPIAPLSVNQAIRSAFLYNPRIREEYARLGLGRAELEEARRIANPSFGYVKLNPQSGGGNQITRSLSLSFTDLLLLPARKRFATGELDRLQKAVAAELLNLATDVEVAWFESVSAAQIAAMRDVVAEAAERSAELAQRFFDAGNITRLQLEQELAAAAQARIAAVRAAADILRARTVLAGLMGLPVEASWTTLAQLPAPPRATFSADALVPLALSQRLDLAAVRQEVTLREDALGVTRRWRWLGAVDLGYEREHELDANVIRGPTLSLQLPIFNQGQGAITRAQAELMDARARLDGLALGVHNNARLGVERLTVQRDIAERYRTLLVPRREAIVARTQEQVNFMLKGVFELILAKQQEYDAYQEYLEAVRDYWTTRAELRRVVGGQLPDDEVALGATIGVDAILPAETPPAMDHSMHGMSPAGEDRTPSESLADPHAGHQMPMPADAAPDPQADHDMSMPATAPLPKADPHAGHQMPMSEPDAVNDPNVDENTSMPGMDMSDPEKGPDEQAQHDHGDTP
jgi:outer membrane protein, heavy metal efflux system